MDNERGEGLARERGCEEGKPLNKNEQGGMFLSKPQTEIVILLQTKPKLNKECTRVNETLSNGERANLHII